MKFTDLFIRRPILALVVNLIIVIAGVQAIRTLNVRQYPRSENAAITVTTVYVGANADLVRGFVTTPLERVIASADGIDYIESQSAQGVSTIRARLRLNYESTKALAEIGSKVDQVRGDLPPEAQVPVINIESADSQFAAAYLSFSSQFLKQNEITAYIVRVVQPRLSALEGVQKADILGARTFAMRIWLKPDRMAALNVSPAQVRAALAANNYLAAVGQTKGQLVQVNLTANTDLRSREEFEQLVVRQDQGGNATVRLRDIADVVLGAEDYDTVVNFSGETAVFVGVWSLPNANSLDVIKKVRTEMDSLQKELPEQITARIAYDGTAYIRSAIREVVSTLRDTLLIVIVVIFLFLGSFRSALVPVVAIPVSLIGGIFLVQVFGFTINLLTLLAIVLSVGLVVDDAIVVVENVERHLREGMKPFDAALKGARELVGPIISMTITLAAVYTPIAFQGGLTGSLFREFALTLAGAVTISGVVALTLSPVMSAYLLRGGQEEKGLAGIINRAFDRVKEAYGRALTATFKVRGAIYVSWVVIGVLALLMFGQSAKELAPAEDQGIIFGILESPANSTLDQIMPSTRMIHNEAVSVPESQFTFQITFPTGGFWGLGLKPWDERKRTAFKIVPEVQGKISAIPGVQSFAIVPPALPGGGNVAVRSYKVIPQLLRVERVNPEQLQDIHVTGPNGQLVALSTIATIRDSVTPRTLNRFQQLNAIKLSGVAMAPLDQALRFLENEAAKLLPKGYTIDYTGESRQLRSEGNKFLPAFGLAVILIFLVLAAQFNSFRDPFVILAGSVPLAMFGALTMTFLKMPNPNMRFFTDGWTTTLNVYSQVGLVTLVGLVSKNGILIVEFANKLQEQGQTKVDAVRNAAMTRLRPVLMTSVATVCGHFPLTLVSGPGAAARNSIGLVLVAGMAIGTAFTLFFVPAIYLLIARDHRAEEAKAPANVAPALESST